MKSKEEDTVVEYKTLSNGVQMPILGYGVEERKHQHDSSKEKKNW